MQHNFKSVYSQVIQAAFFITDAGDVEKVKKVMEKKGRSWSITTTFNFSYIALRVKRTVPPPHMLYCRAKAVFDFSDDKKYTKTRSPLFNDKDRKNIFFAQSSYPRGGILILLGLSAVCTSKKQMHTVDIWWKMMAFGFIDL